MPREYRVLSRRRETARALREREPREYFYVEVSIEKRVVFALAATVPASPLKPSETDEEVHHEDGDETDHDGRRR